MIRLQGLSKSFGGKPALIGLDLEVERGEIFGLLGHNGAGKSTTFGIMLGQVYPDAGEAFNPGNFRPAGSLPRARRRRRHIRNPGVL